MNRYLKITMICIISFLFAASVMAPLCASADGETPDEAAGSFVETVKGKIGKNYTAYCDIETDDQLETLDVNRGFRVYDLTEEMVSKADHALDYTAQADLKPYWKYILTPDGEYGPGIQIGIEEQPDGTYQLIEYGGRAKPFLDAFNEAKKTAERLGMPLAESEIIRIDWSTYSFRAVGNGRDMIIPVSFLGYGYTIHPAITVGELREHMLANIAEGERLREENGGDYVYGTSFRFDLLTDDATAATSSEAHNYLWLYITGGAVIIVTALTAVLILRKKHSANN